MSSVAAPRNAFARHDTIDEPALERFARRQRPARQHEIERDAARPSNCTARTVPPKPG